MSASEKPATKAMLVLLLPGVSYAVERLSPDPEIAKQAWRLTILMGVQDSYDVWEDEHGWHCSCADYTFTKVNTLEMCKHMKGMNEVGLLTPGGHQEDEHAR